MFFDTDIQYCLLLENSVKNLVFSININNIEKIISLPKTKQCDKNLFEKYIRKYILVIYYLSCQKYVVSKRLVM